MFSLKKGTIATHTLIIIAIIGMGLFFLFVGLWYWQLGQRCALLKVACTQAKIDYCTKILIKGEENPEWKGGTVCAQERPGRLISCKKPSLNECKVIIE